MTKLTAIPLDDIRRQKPMCETVVALLMNGYGVEDIHVKTKIGTATIRHIIDKLRRRGTLRDIYGLADD